MLEVKIIPGSIQTNVKLKELLCTHWNCQKVQIHRIGYVDAIFERYYKKTGTVKSLKVKRMLNTADELYSLLDELRFTEF